MRRGLESVPPSVWLAVVVQTAFLIALDATDGYVASPSGEWLRLLLTYAAAASLFLFVHLAFRRARFVANVVVFAVFVAINFARIETAGSFDYGFLHENAGNALTPLGRKIALANVKGLEVALLFAAPLVVGLFVLHRWQWTDVRVVPVRGRRLLAAACVAVLAGLPFAGLTTHESVTLFVASAARFYVYTRAADAASAREPFPYVHEFVPSQAAAKIAGAPPTSSAKRPHVILMFLESWSGRYVDRTRPDGKPFTPVFDKHRREGLSFDHFYGNSVQSCRGHFATLCSLVPMYHAKEVVDLPDTRLHCLPKVLAEAGYRTAVHSATDGPDFDRSAAFLGDIGFASVRFEMGRRDGPNPLIWGAGLQDDLYYPKFFAGIDAELVAHPDQPLFAVGMNAAHHFPFHLRPGHVPDPSFTTRPQRDYIASLTTADAWLEGFFSELEKRPALADAIVVLVGDHSFPADEHGVHFNGIGAYDEVFQTGFMMRWRGHLEPEIVRDRAGSQLDVAPTIADLAQVPHRTHFLGQSLVDRAARPQPFALVQPYSGVFLASVRWPLKLVRHESMDEEHLYDLSKDPGEKTDLRGDPAHAPDVAELRETFTRVHAHESLMRANRIWPPAP